MKLMKKTDAGIFLGVHPNTVGKYAPHCPGCIHDRPDISKGLVVDVEVLGPFLSTYVSGIRLRRYQKSPDPVAINLKAIEERLRREFDNIWEKVARVAYDALLSTEAATPPKAPSMVMEIHAAALGLNIHYNTIRNHLKVCKQAKVRDRSRSRSLLVNVDILLPWLRKTYPERYGNLTFDETKIPEDL